jgi:hypothetical protein
MSCSGAFADVCAFSLRYFLSVYGTALPNKVV